MVNNFKAIFTTLIPATLVLFERLETAICVCPEVYPYQQIALCFTSESRLTSCISKCINNKGF